MVALLGRGVGVGLIQEGRLQAGSVILAGARRTWHRTLVLPFARADTLRQTTAAIAFVTASGERHVNHMDGRAPEVSRRT